MGNCHMNPEKLKGYICGKYSSVRKFCRAYGISEQRFYAMMKKEPCDNTKERMADFLGMDSRERTDIFYGTRND